MFSRSVSQEEVRANELQSPMKLNLLKQEITLSNQPLVNISAAGVQARAPYSNEDSGSASMKFLGKRQF